MDDSESLQLALEFAKEKHKGQKRIGGDDYITHPIAVCEIVKNQGFDVSYQIAALFHDLLEDTDATEEEILNINGLRRRNAERMTGFMLKNILHMNADRAICQYYAKQIADGKNTTLDSSL